MVVLSGTANPDLAAFIAREPRLEIGRCEIQRFPDGEISVDFAQPVRRKEVFMVQPTSPPVDENLIELLGSDLHAPQIEGFFRIPVDSITAVPILHKAFRDDLPKGTVAVPPDAGRITMGTEYASRLNTEVIILHKRRESGTETEVTHVVATCVDDHA